MTAPRTQISYIVHSAVVDKFTAKATVEGEEMDVTVNGLVVELVTEDESMSATLRIKRNVDALAEGFVPGATVTGTFTVVEPK